MILSASSTGSRRRGVVPHLQERNRGNETGDRYRVAKMPMGAYQERDAYDRVMLSSLGWLHAAWRPEQGRAI
jgi:hypothetical protein